MRKTFTFSPPCTFCILPLRILTRPQTNIYFSLSERRQLPWQRLIYKDVAIAFVFSSTWIYTFFVLIGVFGTGKNWNRTVMGKPCFAKENAVGFDCFLLRALARRKVSESGGKRWERTALTGRLWQTDQNGAMRVDSLESWIESFTENMKGQQCLKLGKACAETL